MINGGGGGLKKGSLIKSVSFSLFLYLSAISTKHELGYVFKEEIVLNLLYLA